MRILFLGKYKLDYLQNTLYHGLTSLGHNINANVDYDYMYDCGPTQGKHWTLQNKLQPPRKDSVIPEENLLDETYDLVIFSSIQRYNSNFNDFIKKSAVVCVDGEDNTKIDSDKSNKVLYFKREMVGKDKNVYPITFGIPEELIVESHQCTKEKDWGQIVPAMRRKKTYTFTNEKDYFKDYQKSKYGITHKKSGWDCLRHYEIVMNACLPYFKDIDKCPDLTMHSWDKKLLKEVYSKINLSMSDEEYWKYLNSFQNDLKEKMTTKAIAQQLLSLI